MTKKYSKAVASVMYAVCALGALCAGIADVTSVSVSYVTKFITVIIAFAFGYFASFVLCVPSDSVEYKNKVMRHTFRFLLIIYAVMIIDFTLIDENFGRSIRGLFTLDFNSVLSYVSKNTNFVPFSTVDLILGGLKTGALKPSYAFINILGNFLLFFPFALFLPASYHKFKKFGFYFLACSVFVVLIEILQLLFTCGSLDIDDYILNVSGACFGWLILRVSPVKKYVTKALFGAY